MGGKEETRIFVGGLSWETTERRLEDTFGRFGKVLEAQIMIEKNTGRPRGFGFVTFADKRAVDEAITAMHGRDLDGRPISVNKAVPKVGSDPGYDYGGGGYSSGGRGGYRHSGADRPPPPVGDSDCFKCGRSGHWARECPSTGGGGGGKFSSRPRFGGPGGGRGRDRFGGPDRYGDHLGGSDRYGDRFGGADHFGDRYVDDRYDGSRYGDRDRDRVDSRDSRYSGGRDRYGNDRYPTGGDRFSGDRFGGSDRYPQHGFAKETGFGRGGGPRGGGGDRYGSGGGPGHYEGGSGYRERPGPYDRPSRGRRSSYDRI